MTSRENGSVGYLLSSYPKTKEHVRTDKGEGYCQEEEHHCKNVMVVLNLGHDSSSICAHD